MNKCISILGSTGSIGTQALEVAEAHQISIHALAAGSNIELLEKQVRKYRPKLVCIYNEKCFPILKERLNDLPVTILCGMEGLCTIASDRSANIVLNAVVGMVGLLPTLTAIETGIDVALANKETLVAGGELVMKRAAEKT